MSFRCVACCTPYHTAGRLSIPSPVKADKRTKAKKSCEVCGSESTRLYRVKIDARDWTLVCDACWPAIRDEPGYTYGGTWTTRKR